MEKKSRIYVVAENQDEEDLFKSFKKMCIDQNLNQKELLLKILKEKLQPISN